ncbi:MAG: hypothetical protein M5U19_00070 [Microthrixaceae bacterium]|nr:hypothetical protein [Microthrixaceae bacterium]
MTDPSSDLPGRRRGPRWILVVVAVGVLAAAVVVVGDVNVFAAIGAVLVGLLIMRVGWFLLAQLATPPPPPPDPGTLRRVRLTYRCPSCSAEVRMTSAASEDPEPPRHCMEEMELIASED